MTDETHIIFKPSDTSIHPIKESIHRIKMLTHKLMQSYPARALDRKLQVDWASDAREGPRVLMSLRVDVWPMG